MQKQPDLGTASVGKLLARLALPAITAQVVNMLYNLVDRIYIGHIPTVGTQALTGVGVCFPLIMLVSAFAALVYSGGAPRASIAMGKGENAEAERILGSCTALLLTLSVVLTVVLTIWNRPLLLLFGASEDTILYAEQYMNIYALGTLFVQAALGLNAFITCQGFAKTSMLTVLIGAVINTVLDPIFIFALDMGVQGAALATVISQGISALWVVRFLTSGKTLLRLRPAFLRLNWKLLAPCVALGLSPFIMQSTESLLAVCFNTSLRTYGGTLAVGTMTILTSIMQFAMLPLNGLTQASQPIISYNYGAGKPDRVRRAFWLLLRCAMIYAGVLWATTMLFPQMYIGMFTPDQELIAYAIPAVRIYMAASLLFGIQLSCQQTFVALGNAKNSLFLAVLRKLILLIPLIYLLPALLPDKVTAVFLAEPVADTIAVTVTVLLFRVKFTACMREMEERAASQHA